MQYALLFYNDPATSIETLPAAEREAWFARMRAWREELVRAGIHRSGMRLASVNTARSLRRKGHDVLVTDGPFAETKEVFGGLVVIECADLDQALAWARRCPILEIGTVEVRAEFLVPR
jgi:hypothetical protein